MRVDVSKIITREDINNDLEKLREKLNEGELILFDNNKPVAVLMSVDEYEEIKNKLSNYGQLDSESEEDDLEILLRKVGKQIFINHYYDFKEKDHLEELLPNDFTINSKRSRTSSARKIFKLDRNIEALQNIINSERLESDVINKAREILKSELGDTAENVYIEQQNTIMKIGRTVRNKIKDLSIKNKLSKEEVERMTEVDYSKKVFNSNIPVLKKLRMDISKDEQKKDSRGYNRYYDDEIKINGELYLLSSQWVENLHRKSFNKWIEKYI